MDKDYLKMFENIDKKEKTGLIKETPNYENYNQYENLNETPDVSKFNLNENLNDGWNIDFQFETKVNGEVQRNPSNPYQQKRRRKSIKEDLNGLNQFIDEDENLNEVFKPKQQLQKTERNSYDPDGVITLEMFNNWRRMSLQPLYEKLK
jgi:hypothetical protein